MGKVLFLVFTVVPFVELYLLLAIGRRAGVLPTLVMLVATGVLGAVLARREGRRVIAQWQQATLEGRLPEEGILSGMLVLLGGVLLLTPGVLTDVAGLVLLVPWTRRPVAAWLRRTLEQRVQRGTLRVTTLHVGGFGPPPPPPGNRPRVQGGSEDAEFSEDTRPPR